MTGAVEIRRDGSGFVVTLDPPIPDYPDRRFDCARSARGWAGGLRLTLGRRKIDHTREVADG